MSSRSACAKRLLIILTSHGAGTQTFQPVRPAEFYSADPWRAADKTSLAARQRSATPLGAQAKSLCSCESNFQKRRQNPKTRDDCATQCAGNFRDPAFATSMVNRHFENAQTGPGRFHLHF